MLKKEIETIEEIPRICPVCNGSGIVRVSIYNVAGVTCSYEDYYKNSSIGSCKTCNGKGTIICKKITKTSQINYTKGRVDNLPNDITELEEKIKNLERCGAASEFYISNMRNALSSVKKGDMTSALKFLIIVLSEAKTASDKKAVEQV